MKALRGTLLFSMLSVAAVAQGGEYELHPSLAVSEEYTDNVYETNTNREFDYITRVLPGLAASYKAPALTGDLSYVFDYRNYARGSHKDDTTHALSAKAKLTAADNLLFLDVSDEYQRVSLDVTRDVTKESLFVGQADRNIVTVSPYLTLRPSERIPIKAGYRFINTRYFSLPAIDKTDHIAFFDLAYELTKRFSLTAGYTFTREIADIGNFSQHQGLAGFRYEYADKSFIFAQAGNSWIEYDNGRHLNGFVWNAGFTHEFDSISATITTGVKLDEDPLSNSIQESFVGGTLEKRFQRGTLSISPNYSEYVMTETAIQKTRKYGSTAKVNYEFSTDFKGRLAFTIEKYEQLLQGGYTRRSLVDSGLSYLLADQLTVSLSYIFVNYFSPSIVADNREINRAMIEIKKTF